MTDVPDARSDLFVTTRWTMIRRAFAMRSQARERAYMNGLSSNDIEQLIRRSEALLMQGQGVPNPEDAFREPRILYSDGSSTHPPIPNEFSEMRVLNIIVTANAVCYVWMGGMDHTNLLVKRDKTGNWTVDAYFSDDFAATTFVALG